MDQKIIPMLFALLRSAISGIPVTAEFREQYSPELLSDLMKLSSKHDMAHLLVWGLKQNELLGNEDTTLEACIFKAVYRCERLRYDYDVLCNALEAASIPFLPLKGSVIRGYYPEAWMRTSCDIDVLIHEEDLERAKELLVRDYGYTDHGTSTHDVSFFTPTNNHIELWGNG